MAETDLEAEGLKRIAVWNLRISKAAWFVGGFFASSLVHLLLTTTPDEALANLQGWLQ